MFCKYIDFRIFIVTFAIGALYIYMNEDYKKVIVIHPTPDNYDQYQFKDKSGSCFSYELKEVKCPNDKKLIQNIQIQK
jgi:hypothetical protein